MPTEPSQDAPEQNVDNPAETAQAIGTAGVAAAQAEPEPARKPAAAKRAIRQAAESRNLRIPDEQLEQMAQMSANLTIDGLEARGAFDPPPEPVTAPPQPTAPPAPADATQPAPESVPAGDQPPQVPKKRTWAHKFMGIE